jgi:hypothetical protein
VSTIRHRDHTLHYMQACIGQKPSVQALRPFGLTPLVRPDAFVALHVCSGAIAKLGERGEYLNEAEWVHAARGAGVAMSGIVLRGSFHCVDFRGLGRVEAVDLERAVSMIAEWRGVHGERMAVWEEKEAERLQGEAERRAEREREEERERELYGPMEAVRIRKVVREATAVGDLSLALTTIEEARERFLQRESVSGTQAILTELDEMEQSIRDTIPVSYGHDVPQRGHGIPGQLPKFHQTLHTVCARTSIHPSIHLSIYLYIQCTYIHTYIHTYMHAYIQIYTYIHIIQIYTRTTTYMNKYTPSPSNPFLPCPLSVGAIFDTRMARAQAWPNLYQSARGHTTAREHNCSAQGRETARGSGSTSPRLLPRSPRRMAALCCNL